MHSKPRALAALLAIVRGYAPRVLQARGWVLAGLACAPVGIALAVQMLRHAAEPTGTAALDVFHSVLVRLILPIMAFVAAPAGIREDLEQRTLPLLLVRPAPVWTLPFAKGFLWFSWGALWLALASLGLASLGIDPESAFLMALALVSAFWAQLAFLSLLGLVFKRGTLWGAIFLFAWDPLIRIQPGNLQRFTFLHYIESIAGSRGLSVSRLQILAQEQVSTPWPLAVLVLLAFGTMCWALCGWKLNRTPIGLAGAESEG